MTVFWGLLPGEASHTDPCNWDVKVLLAVKRTVKWPWSHAYSSSSLVLSSVTWHNVYAREIKSLTFYIYFLGCYWAVQQDRLPKLQYILHLSWITQEAKWQVIIFHPNGFYQGFYHSLSKVCKGRGHPHRIQCYKNSQLSCWVLSYVSSWIILLARGSTDPSPHSTWCSLVTSKCLWNPVKSQRSHRSSPFYWYSHSYFLSFRTENKSTLLDAIWTLLIIYSNKFSYQHLIKCFLVLLIGGKSKEKWQLVNYEEH